MRRNLRFGYALPLCSLVVLAADTKQVDRTVPINAGGQVLIDTYKGKVHVTAWDEPRVEIHAKVEPDGWDSADLVRDTEVVIDPGPSSVRIKSNYDRAKRFGFFSFSGSLPFVNYTIRMPRTATLRIKDYKSDIQVAGLRADVDINTYKGDTRIEDLGGSLRMNTYKGTVRAGYIKLGRSYFETYKGEIEIRVPGESHFDLETDLGRHASLTSDFPTPRRERRGQMRSRVTVNGSGPLVELKSYRGDFRLRRS